MFRRNRLEKWRLFLLTQQMKPLFGNANVVGVVFNAYPATLESLGDHSRCA